MSEQQYLAADAIDTIRRTQDRVVAGVGTEEDFDTLSACADFLAEWLSTHYGLSDDPLYAHDVDDFVDFVVSGGKDDDEREE